MVNMGELVTAGIGVTVFLIILAQVTIPIGFEDFQAELESSANPNLTQDQRDILETFPIIIVVAFFVLIFGAFGLMKLHG